MNAGPMAWSPWHFYSYIFVAWFFKLIFLVVFVGSLKEIWIYLIFVIDEQGMKLALKGLKKVLFLFVQSCRNPVNQAVLEMSYL